MASMEYMTVYNSKSTATAITDTTNWEAKMPTVYSCAGNDLKIASPTTANFDGVIQSAEGGYFVATAVLNNDSTNQGHGSIRQAPAFRFRVINSGGASTNRKVLAEHTYQRTSGQECGAYLKEILYIAAGDTVQIDWNTSSAGTNWQVNFDLSYFRLERLMPGDDEDGLHFIQRQSTSSQSLNSTTAITWNTAIDGTVYEKGTNVSHSITTNNTRWTANKAGIYRAHAHVYMSIGSGSLARDTPSLQFRKNGTDWGYAVGGMGYVRATSGHFHSSNVVEELWNLNQNDYIECMNVNRNGGGTSGSNSVMFMEYLGPKYT